MIQVRLQGLPEDIEQLAQGLSDSGLVELLDQSPHYPNRPPSQFVRCYLTTELAPPPSHVARPGRLHDEPGESPAGGNRRRPAPTS